MLFSFLVNSGMNVEIFFMILLYISLLKSSSAFLNILLISLILLLYVSYKFINFIFVLINSDV